MYLRLAFAVAAHLEPEILLVDEVLAVGDADFQKKCLGKMGDVAQEGRTVLFVSHNMPAVQALCARAILLRTGSVAMDGSTGDVLREYLGHLQASAAHAFENNPERRGDGQVRLTGARVLDAEGRPTQNLVAGMPMTLEFAYENRVEAERAELLVAIVNHLGITVTHLSTKIAGFRRGARVDRIRDLPDPVAPTASRGVPRRYGRQASGSAYRPHSQCPRVCRRRLGVLPDRQASPHRAWRLSHGSRVGAPSGADRERRGCRRRGIEGLSTGQSPDRGACLQR